MIAVGMGMLLSFTYGMATAKYKIFPYDQLREIKKTVITSPSPSPSPSRTLRYSDYFFDKISFFDQHGGHHYDIVFIGDSITDGAEWGELFPTVKIANRGINGDRTDSVLKRMDSIYATSARRAFMMIGINDFTSGMSVGEVFENYSNIVSKLTAQEMKVYIQSTIIAGKQKEKLNKKIAKLNKKLQKLATKSESVTYIDLNFRMAQDKLLNAMYSRDGVHLNGEGYAVWKEIITPYIQ
jgi:lysophospholipase L1-like esterase